VGIWRRHRYRWYSSDRARRLFVARTRMIASAWAGNPRSAFME
jgi:hypothetical protein